MLCYKIDKLSGQKNELATTDAQEGSLSALVKNDCEASKAQIYSELVANRLAMFLGIPVAIGVLAKHCGKQNKSLFASLITHEDDLDLYDFTQDDERDVDEFKDSLPEGILANYHHQELVKISENYPKEFAFLAVFDLWIGNQDRELNFKAELSKGERGIFFALDQGSSLLSCETSIDGSLELLLKETYPSFHIFKSLVNPVYAGQMIGRIQNMPDWAIESAVIHNDTIGNVLLPDQYALSDALSYRKGILERLFEQCS
jgi:hypothetical protein